MGIRLLLAVLARSHRVIRQYASLQLAADHIINADCAGGIRGKRNLLFVGGNCDMARRLARQYRERFALGKLVATKPETSQCAMALVFRIEMRTG